MEKKLADQKIKMERFVWFNRKYIPLFNGFELGKITRDEFFKSLTTLCDELEQWDQKHGWN